MTMLHEDGLMHF